MLLIYNASSIIECDATVPNRTIIKKASIISVHAAYNNPTIKESVGLDRIGLEGQVLEQKATLQPS